MKTVLWLCATLAIAGSLDQAAGIRNVLDTSQAQQTPSSSADSPVIDLAKITNPHPGILVYPNAPGYPPDLAPDPAFMDLPSYALSPGKPAQQQALILSMVLHGCILLKVVSVSSYSLWMCGIACICSNPLLLLPEYSAVAADFSRTVLEL